jgi:hypothetical protein
MPPLSKKGRRARSLGLEIPGEPEPLWKAENLRKENLKSHDASPHKSGHRPIHSTNGSPRKRQGSLEDTGLLEFRVVI